MDDSDSILLTGGTGFFGKALLRHWKEKHELGEKAPTVTVLTRDPEFFSGRYPYIASQPWLTFARGDISDFDSLPSGKRYTHILHAAADSTLGPQQTPLQRYDQIVQGTRNMLDYALACEARRFLLTSSGGVYGPQPADIERLPETWLGMPDPLNPANAYSVAKRAAEHLCALYRTEHGLETVIARCFAFVGEDLPLNVHFAIGNFIRDALWADAITIAGDGRSIRSYLDQRDLAAWLLTLLAKGRAGQAYNVGSDRSISVAALANLVGELISPSKTLRIMGEAIEPQQRSIYVPDISRARAELSLEVTFPLEQSIVDTARAVSRKLLNAG